MSPLRSGILIVLGLVSLVGYGTAAVGLYGAGRAADVLAFLALFAALFGVYFTALVLTRRGAAIRQILLWALLFRLALLPAGLPPATWLAGLGRDVTSQAVAYRTFLLYDNDVWRYLWDGHVTSSGFDPYGQTPAELEAMAENGEPAAEALFAESLWQDVYDNVSFRRYRSVYPPLAQLLFRLHHAAAPGSVFVLKLALALVDFATCLVLVSILRRLGRPPALVLVYAWNPLVIKEIAGSGHVDALMICFLVLSVELLLRGRRRAGLVVYGLAILSKLVPVLLVGLYLRRTRVREWPILPLTVLAGFLPFFGSWLAVGRGLAAFSREWVFNPGPWALCKWLAEQAGLPGRETAGLVAAVLSLALVAGVVLKDDGSGERLVSGSFLILGGFVVLSATVMPWYLLWALPFAAVRRPWAWATLTCLSLLSYLIYIDQVEHSWWLWTEFLLFFLVLGLDRIRGPSPPPGPGWQG